MRLYVNVGEAMDADDMPQPSAAAPTHTSSAVSASRLSRLFFTLGQVAIQHLVSQQQLYAAHDMYLYSNVIVFSCINLASVMLLCIAIAVFACGPCKLL